MFPHKAYVPSSNLERQLSSFARYLKGERGYSPETIIKNQDCIRQIAKVLGSSSVEEIGKEHIRELKADMVGKGLSIARMHSLLLAFRSYLLFCRDELGIHLAMEPKEISIPKRPRSEVVYLTPEEIQRFVSAIEIRRKTGGFNMDALRFRALVESLLGSAMRISEVLSLNRDTIDFKEAEAKVQGKGRKKRMVFFTDRALMWIKTYLSARVDDNPALFVTRQGERLKRSDIWRFFRLYKQRAGIKKKLTAHILRHTAATHLLFQGCPIGHIKEILGHERLETTCRYYLGLDHREAKKAHRQYLKYQVDVLTA